MKKMILAATLAFGAVSFAGAAEPEMTCGSDSFLGSSVYDIKEGYYASSNTQDFCTTYRIDRTDYNSCSGNITSLDMSCEESKWTETFTCRDGVCTNANGTRRIDLDSELSDWAKYTRTKDGNRYATSLRYQGPCN
jgi:hypothetical protein